MAITLKGKGGTSYSFEGPFTDTNDLENRSGVYAILCDKDGKLTVVDVGEASDVKARVQSHDRKDCWKRNCSGTLKFAAFYIAHGKKPSRVEVEQDIRDFYNPPCGER